MPNIVSRTAAIVRGLDMYFTGLPCKRGHVAERYVCNCVCNVCNKSGNMKRYDNVKGTPESHYNVRGRRNYKEKYYFQAHGLTKEEFDMLLESQKGKCACCKSEFSDSNPPEIDHKHHVHHEHRWSHRDKSSVRGLLCRMCNKMVAGFDSPLRETYAAYVDHGGFL